MPELRKDPILDRWVVIAENRAAKPQEFADPPTARSSGSACPFCEGNEHQSAGELLAVRHNDTPANGPGWTIRVVPNKYPALLLPDPPQPVSLPIAGNPGLEFLTAAGIGAHEVIVDSPRHLRSATELDPAAMADLFDVYRRRLLRHADDRRLKHAIVFKNVGPQAGASIEHLHSQLIALPMVPPALAEELAAGRQRLDETGGCAWCAMMESELADGRRVVLETEEFVAICPFASRFPYEVCLLPKRHQCRFELSPPELIAAAAQSVRELLTRLELALDHPSYNYLIHSAPFDIRQGDHYHWHIEIFPRITNAAGFEWGTGCFINPHPPEAAAARLRNVKSDQSG